MGKVLVLLASSGAAASVIVFVIGLVKSYYRTGTVRSRLMTALHDNTIEPVHVRRRSSASSQLFRKMAGNIANSVVGYLPRNSTRKIEEQVRFAGLHESLVSTIIAMRTLGGFGIGLLFATLALFSHKSVATGIIYGGVVGLVVYMAPWFWVKGKAKTRQRAIRHALPDAIDLLTLCMTSMNFENALKRVVEKTPQIIGEELQIVLHDLQMNISRGEALQRLSDRIGIDELRSFVSSILQAEKHGTPLAQILQIQAEDMRISRKQRAEALARQAPMKMMLPLIIFIFPALIIVVVGPVIPKILHMVAPGISL